ncbi:MAG: oxaloacetate decarboxylase, partial [Pseudomonas sp.]|nr:oxaloacetate decarboxylase [Pseudomonas sp.]
TYDSLRAQRQLTHSTDNLSATELTHTYTLPENYVAWAEEFMDVKE